jgi:hypothetical protein
MFPPRVPDGNENVTPPLLKRRAAGQRLAEFAALRDAIKRDFLADLEARARWT